MLRRKAIYRWIAVFLMMAVLAGGCEPGVPDDPVNPPVTTQMQTSAADNGTVTETVRLTEEVLQEETIALDSIKVAVKQVGNPSQNESGGRDEPPVPEQPQAVTEAETAAAVQYPARVPNTGEGSGHKLIIVGDSRTVGLYCSQVYDREEWPKHIFYNISETDYTGVIGDTVFIAKPGEGLDWFDVFGRRLMERHLDGNTVLVFWFGVNDPNRSADYIPFINNKLLSYGIPIYCMTVGPCVGENRAEKEALLEQMNELLKTQLDTRVHVIDAFDFLEKGLNYGAFGTLDGLHYDYNTCCLLYDYIVRVVERGED